MFFHELWQLADLIRFGLAADVLQIHQCRHTGAAKDMMAAAGADVVEAKGRGQLQCFRNPEVRRALQSMAKQLARIISPSLFPRPYSRLKNRQNVRILPYTNLNVKFILVQMMHLGRCFHNVRHAL